MNRTTVALKHAYVSMLYLDGARGKGSNMNHIASISLCIHHIKLNAILI